MSRNSRKNMNRINPKMLEQESELVEKEETSQVGEYEDEPKEGEEIVHLLVGSVPSHPMVIPVPGSIEWDSLWRLNGLFLLYTITAHSSASLQDNAV